MIKEFITKLVKREGIDLPRCTVGDCKLPAKCLYWSAVPQLDSTTKHWLRDENGRVITQKRTEFLCEKHAQDIPEMPYKCEKCGEFECSDTYLLDSHRKGRCRGE